ncbi:MAG: outer membrane beta-barrel protein [Planctomycetes bacterium]|nr:outer membrane beta-barrel protein [Planctomycetota bacterium]
MMHTLFLMVAMTCPLQEGPQREYEDHLGLGLPGVRVTGGLSVEVWQDDNILLSREEEKEDIITVLVPEVDVQLGGDDVALRVGYRGRDRQYLHHSRFNGMEHAIDGAFHYAVGSFAFDVWDAYQDRNDPFSLPSDTRRIDWLQNDFGGAAAVDLSWFALEAGAEVRRLELFDPAFDLFDHRRWQGSLLAAAGVSSKVQAIVESGLGHSEYDNENVLDDFNFAWHAGGLRGALAENVHVLLKAGWFRVGVDNTSGVVDSRNDDGLYLASAVNWRPADDAAVTLELQRRPVESIYTGWMVAERVDVGVTYRFGERLTASLGSYYERLEESLGGEDRKAYGLAHTGLRWSVSRHLTLSAGGELRSKRSDEDTFEYDNVRGFVGATVMW